MTIQEARKILGVTKNDDSKIIKQKFRKLIMKHHPDAVGENEPERIRKAQQLNEAYAVLRGKTGARQFYDEEPVWNGKINEAAFTERTIYMAEDAWEGRKRGFYKVAKGRYEWNPDNEDFDCLLKSLNQAAMELLEETERKHGIFNEYEYDINEVQFEYQLKLFHLLAGQFIPPVASLKRIADPDSTDKQGREIYRFQALIGTKGKNAAYIAMSALVSGDIVYAVSLKNNRIMVADAKGVKLGHLSLADDQLYYVIIPILQHHRAQVKFVVTDVEAGGVGSYSHLKLNVDLYLRLEKDAAEIQETDANLQIGEALNAYGERLREIVR